MEFDREDLEILVKKDLAYVWSKGKEYKSSNEFKLFSKNDISRLLLHHYNKYFQLNNTYARLLNDFNSKTDTINSISRKTQEFQYQKHLLQQQICSLKNQKHQLFLSLQNSFKLVQTLQHRVQLYELIIRKDGSSPDLFKELFSRQTRIDQLSKQNQRLQQDIARLQEAKKQLQGRLEHQSLNSLSNQVQKKIKQALQEKAQLFKKVIDQTFVLNRTCAQLQDFKRSYEELSHAFTSKCSELQLIKNSNSERQFNEKLLKKQLQTREGEIIGLQLKLKKFTQSQTAEFQSHAEFQKNRQKISKKLREIKAKLSGQLALDLQYINYLSELNHFIVNQMLRKR